MNTTINSIRDLVQIDIGQRGLKTNPEINLVTACVGDFSAACHSIAEHRSPALAIVTGFFIPQADPPAGETDGPLGALFLARALVPAGIPVALITDSYCRTALQAGLEAVGLENRVPLVILPTEEAKWPDFFEREWQGGFLKRFPLSHLIALERVGPSHTPESLRKQPGVEQADIDRFLREIPASEHDRCHTMRGRDITALTGPAHRLFETTESQKLPSITIGIGDGGNEIGMGKIRWSVIAGNVPRGELTACRIPTDHLIVCGISNWGAYALAAGVLALGDRGTPAPKLFDPEPERTLLQRMVECGPLVDGVLGKPRVSVDGLDFERYAQVLVELGRLLTGS